MTDTTVPALADDTTPAEATALPHLLGVLRSQVTAALEDWFSNETVNYAAGIEPADAVMAVVGPALEQVHGHRTEVAARAAAAERQRIRHLAIERDARWQPTAICSENCTRAPHPYPSGPTAPFASLLAAEDPPPTTEETR